MTGFGSKRHLSVDRVTAESYDHAYEAVAVDLALIRDLKKRHDELKDMRDNLSTDHASIVLGITAEMFEIEKQLGWRKR